jgi:SAM-dependent methyltransferase
VPTFQFAKQLLARAYNNLQENPPSPSDAPRPQVDIGRIDALIARWRSMIPAQGHILELGCGAGDDRTIGAWLREGYRVTGVDVSGASLVRARAAFPQATFLEMMPSELRAAQEFDAGYSALMFLHMDPIELRVALHRLYCALKPDAPFFVLSVVENVQVRYSPVDMYCGEWVWQWYYEPEEIIRAFTEHGHFAVLAQEVVVLDGDIDDLDARTPKSWHEMWATKPRVTLAYAILAQRSE